MHRPWFFRPRCFAITLLMLGATGMAQAETPQSFLEEYRQAAKARAKAALADADQQNGRDGHQIKQRVGVDPVRHN